MNFRFDYFRQGFLLACAALAFLFQACDSDDPEPVNEEEVITTVTVTLVPTSGGSTPVILKFYDADGEQGSTAPVITVSGPLEASTNYTGVIELENETENPAGNVSEEVAAEADAHLFCFGVDGDIVITYEDEDENELPLGLVTTWATGSAPGDASVTITLRHQEGTKTGECPGPGETDVEVTFDLTIE